MKDIYTLVTDADVTELLADLKNEGWYYAGGFNRPIDQPAALLNYKAVDPQKVKETFNFVLGNTVVPIMDRSKFKVFTPEEYAEYQSIFGGGI